MKRRRNKMKGLYHWHIVVYTQDGETIIYNTLSALADDIGFVDSYLRNWIVGKSGIYGENGELVLCTPENVKSRAYRSGIDEKIYKYEIRQFPLSTSAKQMENALALQKVRNELRAETERVS